jgi:glycosyltransferase involved in cell wall biosynthesis
VTTPLRVSLDVSAVPADPAGAGRYTIELAHALGRQPDVALTLWARRRDSARWTTSIGSDDGARVRAEAPDSRPARLVWEQARLPALLRRGALDLHHSPHYTMPERALLPVVVTVHDLTFFDHPEWHQGSKAMVFRRAITVAARRAAALVCVSRRTAERLDAEAPPRGPVYVVPHGVDHVRFRPDEPSPGYDQEVFARLGVTQPFVVFTGTLEPRKAVPDLVAAFDHAASSRPDLRLVLAGRPGWGSAAVDRALATARNRDRVLRLGYVADDDLPALVRGACVVAYPALEEGFGLPALEALACGTPLVTTEGSVMADMADGAAIVVPPGAPGSLAEAMGAVVDAGGDVARRELGLAVAARHTWDAAARGHVAAYRAATGALDPGVSGPDR